MFCSSGDPTHSLQQLGLEPKVLGIKGVPEHTVASLYRALAAHAGAWQQLVASELEQLRQVLQQQGGPALNATIQILNGPIMAHGAAAAGLTPTAAAAGGTAGAGGGTSKDDKKALAGEASGSRVSAAQCAVARHTQAVARSTQPPPVRHAALCRVKARLL
jgi:hypothetical protein